MDNASKSVIVIWKEVLKKWTYSLKNSDNIYITYFFKFSLIVWSLDPAYLQTSQKKIFITIM
jgi:hypothetical protein